MRIGEAFYQQWQRELKDEGAHHPSKCPINDCTYACNKCEKFYGRQYRSLSEKEKVEVSMRIVGSFDYEAKEVITWCSLYDGLDEMLQDI